MKWYSKLYLGEQARKKRYKIIHKIKHRKLVKDVFVLTLPHQSGNVMDIYPANVLLQRYYQKRETTVIGIAKGRDEAFRLLERIIMECFRATGDFKLVDFIENGTK